jgi:hypothetical protein
MRAVICVVGFLLTTMQARGENPISTFALGIGNETCASWQQNYRKYGESWIFGFWSGVNVFNSDHTVGLKTNSSNILVEVGKICDQNPTMKLIEAVNEQYLIVMKRESGK